MRDRGCEHERVPTAPQPVTFTSRTNRVLAIASWAVLAALGVPIVLAAEPRGQLATALVAAWLGVLAWGVLWRPSLTVGDAITIDNPFRTVRMPWEALVHVDTKYALTLFTPGRRFPVWCAPQPGSLAANRVVRRIRRDPSATSALDQGVRVGDLPGTESGDAAAAVRERWQQQLDTLRAVDPEAAVIDVRVHWWLVAVAAGGPLVIALVPLVL